MTINNNSGDAGNSGEGGTPSTMPAPSNTGGAIQKPQPVPEMPTPAPPKSGRSRTSYGGVDGTPLTPTPDPIPVPAPPPVIIPDDPPSIEERTFTFIPSTDALPVVYGSIRVGAQVFCAQLQADGVFVVGYAISWGPINAISYIQIDGKAIGSYTSNYHIHLTNDGIDPILLKYFPSVMTRDFQKSIAYVVAAFPAPAAGQPIPNYFNALFDGQWKLIYDPRTDATLTTKYYRDSPALIAADWKSSTDYGDAEPLSAVYGASPGTSSLVDAANDCDFDIGGGTKRYTLGCHITKRSSKDNLDYIKSHAALQLTYNSGTWNFWIDKARPASAVALTDQGSGANIVSVGPLTIEAQRNTPTRFSATYVDSTANYQDRPVNDDDPGLAGGTVDFVEQTMTFGCIPYDQAKRLLKQFRKASDVKKFPVKCLADGGEQILPGIVVPVTSSDHNLSAVPCIVSDWATSGDSDKSSSWQGWLTIYDASVYDDTKQSTTGYIPPVAPSPYDVPPNPLNVAFGANDADGFWTLYWDQASTVTEPHYGAAFWSQTNCANYVAANVNDGNVAVKAFDWNVAADSTLTYDAGAGVTKKFRRLSTWVSSGGIVPVVEYSDNGSSWTGVTMVLNNLVYPPDAGATITIGWADAGAHRYWRMRKGSAFAFPSDFYEVQWGEVTQAWPFVTDYFVYGPSGALFATYAAGALPTSATPLSLRGLMTIVTDPATGNKTKSVTATIYASAGTVRSSGVTVTLSGVSSAASLSLEQLTLSGGLNSNIDISGLSNPSGDPHLVAYVQGPLVSFSIGGFTPVHSAKSLTVYNGTGVGSMTLIDNDASTTSGKRLKTFGITSVINFAHFVYSVSLGFWVLVAYR